MDTTLYVVATSRDDISDDSAFYNDIELAERDAKLASDSEFTYKVFTVEAVIHVDTARQLS